MEYRILQEPEPPQPFVGCDVSKAELDPDPPAVMRRRQWLLGCAGLLFGGVAGLAGRSVFGGQQVAPSTRTAPEWLLAMGASTDAEIVERAGEFEFAARRESPVPGATAVFERLLRVASAADGPAAVAASKCAIRALAYQGAPSAVERWLLRHAGSARHGEAAIEARRVLGRPEVR